MKDIESLGRQDELPVSDGVLIWRTQRGRPGGERGTAWPGARPRMALSLAILSSASMVKRFPTTTMMLRMLDKHKLGDTVRSRLSAVVVATVSSAANRVPATNRRRGYGE